MKEKIFFMVYKNLVSDCWLFRERFHVLDAAKLLEICEIAKIVRGISDFRLYKFFSISSFLRGKRTARCKAGTLGAMQCTARCSLNVWLNGNGIPVYKVGSIN